MNALRYARFASILYLWLKICVVLVSADRRARARPEKMLNPNASETPQPGEEGAPRQRTPAPAPVLQIDPSWRAGRKLEEARRQLGLSYEQISSRIRVRREFLEALEAMNAKLLPGKAYALAYLRSYAAMLGLDAQAIVEQYQDECALSREDARAQVRLPESRPHPERPWLAAVLLVAIGAGFMAFRAWQDSQPAEVVAEAETSAPTAAASAGATGRNVEIVAIEGGWIEVRGPDGTVFLSRTMRAGERFAPDPSPGWTIHARDGGAFQLYVDGQPAGPLGTTGMPVLGRQIDSIEALPQPALSPPTVQRRPAPAPAGEQTPPAAAPAPTPPVSEAAPEASPAGDPPPAG